MPKRTDPRTPLHVRLVCWMTAPGLPRRVPAVLLEASTRGCGLYLAERVEPGAVTRLELTAGPSALRGALGLRLAHVRPAPRGGFEAGGEFDVPLSQDELRALVGEH